MGQPVIHFELWTKNPEKVTDFYAKVFDWNIQNIPEMNYRIVDTGGQGINGGIMTPKMGEPPWPGNMSFYIDVEDLEAYSEKVKAAGGKIVVPRMDVPGAGSFTLFEDPDGRVMGLWLKTDRD